MKTITEAIEVLRDIYLERYSLADAEEINCGYCVDFAEEMESLYRGSGSITSDLLVNEREGCDGFEGDGTDEWDEETLLLYHSPPPDGMRVDELAHRIGGYHAWIHYDGKHYDAECPEGVRNLFDLPFFKRHLAIPYEG